MAVDKDGRCECPPGDSSHWCQQHRLRCTNLNRKYKSKCSQVDATIPCHFNDIDNATLEELQRASEEIRQRYVHLRTCYQKRMDHRRECVHSDEYDEGHNIQLKLLRDRIRECSRLLERIYKRADELHVQEEEQESSDEYENTTSPIKSIHRRAKKPSKVASNRLPSYELPSHESIERIDPKLEQITQLLNVIEEYLGDVSTIDSLIRVIDTVGFYGAPHGESEEDEVIIDIYKRLARNLAKGANVNIFEVLREFPLKFIVKTRRELERDLTLILPDSSDEFISKWTDYDSYIQEITREKQGDESPTKQAIIKLITKNLQNSIDMTREGADSLVVNIIYWIMGHEIGYTRSAFILDKWSSIPKKDLYNLTVNKEIVLFSEKLLTYIVSIPELKRMLGIVLSGSWKRYSNIPAWMQL